MGALTQTITAMRTKGMPLLCANCRDERDRVAMRRYKRAMYTTWKKEREG
jgi:hypothetical protein